MFKKKKTVKEASKATTNQTTEDDKINTELNSKMTCEECIKISIKDKPKLLHNICQSKDLSERLTVKTTELDPDTKITGVKPYGCELHLPFRILSELVMVFAKYVYFAVNMALLSDKGLRAFFHLWGCLWHSWN